jgi:hypothetical protein
MRRQRQQGVTLTGFITTAVVVIFFLLLGFKIGPAYLEFYSIEKQFKAIVADPISHTGNRKDIEGAFVARATIENITSIGPADLQVEKDGDQIVLSAEYSRKVPLVGNLSACMDFAPSSASK